MHINEQFDLWDLDDNYFYSMSDIWWMAVLFLGPSDAHDSVFSSLAT